MGKNRGRWMLALVAMVALTLPSRADAASERLELVAPENDIQNMGMVLDWDTDSGEAQGLVTFEPRITETTTEPPFPVLDVVATTYIAPSEDPNISGRLDPATGEADLVSTHTLRTEIDLGEDFPLIVCDTAVFELDWSTQPDGVPLAPLPFDSALDYAITLSTIISIPAYENDDCTLNGTVVDGVAETINEVGELPLSIPLPIPFERGTPPEPPPPAPETTTTTTAPPTTTTAPPVAAPAAPVAEQPNLAG